METMDDIANYVMPSYVRPGVTPVHRFLKNPERNPHTRSATHADSRKGVMLPCKNHGYAKAFVLFRSPWTAEPQPVCFKCGNHT
jgi:hypothetical protein